MMASPLRPDVGSIRGRVDFGPFPVQEAPEGGDLPGAHRMELQGHWQGFIEVVPRPSAPDEVDLSASTPLAVALDGLLWGTSPVRDAHGLSALMTSQGDSALDRLRGSYSIATADSNQQVVRLHADPIRSRELFYALTAEGRLLLFSSDLFDLVAMMRAEGLPVRRDDQAAWYMLAFGFMLDDRTLVDGVRRVSPGTVLTFAGGAPQSTVYIRFVNRPFEGKLEKKRVIDGLEDRFRNAVSSAFTSDDDRGRAHIATLSGGLDSRTTVIAATQLGHTSILTCTTSESGYLDQRIAARVAADLRLRNLFYALDNGLYLGHLRDAVRANGGMVFATGSAHMLNFVREIELRRYGVLHMGINGEVLGTYLSGPRHEHVNPLAGSNSTFLAGMAREIAEPVWNSYETDEAYIVNVRGLNAVLNGYHTLAKLITCESPFLDPDFFSYCLSIPPEVRWASTGAGIYRDWTLAMRGPVGRYQWERTGMPVSAPTRVARASMYGFAAARRLPLLHYRGSMNPMKHWFRHTPRLEQIWDETFDRGIHRLDDDAHLAGTARRLYLEGGLNEKDQVNTLLMASELLGLE